MYACTFPILISFYMKTQTITIEVHYVKLTASPLRADS